MPTFTNQATLLYNTGVANSNIVTGEILRVLSATKTVLDTGYRPGSPVTYVVSIVNSGSTPYSNLTVTDDLGPEVVGISVLELAQALHRKHDTDITGADHTERSTEIRTVRSTADSPDVIELVQDQIDRNRAPPLRRQVSKASQLDEQE